MRALRALLVFLALLPSTAYAISTSAVSGTAITKADGTTTMAAGAIKFRVNDCDGHALTLYVAGVKTESIVAAVTAGAFSAPVSMGGSTFCYQVGVYDAATGSARFLPGYGAFSPAAATVNFNTAPTTTQAPDTSVTPADAPGTTSTSGGSSGGGGSTPPTTSPTPTPTSATYVLPVAGTSLGGVKIQGNGLAIDSNGYLSVTGTATALTMGAVVTGAAGSNATANISGNVLSLTVPRGATGANGVTPTFTVGTTTQLAAGAPPTVTLTGTAPNYVLNLGIPAGAGGAAFASTATPQPGQVAVADSNGQYQPQNLNYSMMQGPTPGANGGFDLPVGTGDTSCFASAAGHVVGCNRGGKFQVGNSGAAYSPALLASDVGSAVASQAAVATAQSTATAAQAAANTAVQPSGGTMTGPLNVTSPTAATNPMTANLADRQTGGVLTQALQSTTYGLAKNHNTFNDGTEVWTPAPAYPNLYLSDFELTESSLPEYFTAAQVQGLLDKVYACPQNTGTASTSGSFPSAVSLTGACVQYYSPFQPSPARADGDAEWFLPVGEYDLWKKTGSTAHFMANAPALERALALIPVDATTGLVQVVAGQTWAPWLFQESAQFTGDVTMASGFYYRDAVYLSALYTAAGDTTDAARWTAVATKIQGSMGTSSALWDATDGMYYAATGQNRQIDILGSAFAVYMGIATPAQQTAISAFFNTNYAGLFKYGYSVQVYDTTNQNSWKYLTPGCVSNGSVQGVNCANGQYQSGYWSVGNLWIETAMRVTNVQNAAQLALDQFSGPDPNLEYFDQFDLGKGSTPNLESPAGTTAYLKAHPEDLFNMQPGCDQGFGTTTPDSYNGIILGPCNVHHYSSSETLRDTWSSPFPERHNRNPASGEDWYWQVDWTNSNWRFMHHPVTGADTTVMTLTPNGVTAPSLAPATSATFIPGTPTIDSASVPGVAFGVPSTSTVAGWSRNDLHFLLTVKPTSNVDAGTKFAVVDFGKACTDLNGNSEFPLTYPPASRLRSSDGISVGVDGAPFTNVAPASPTQVTLVLGPGQTLVSGTTYAWTVNSFCDTEQ